MPKLLGVIGALVICAGLDLLWQGRHELQFWLSACMEILRAVVKPERSLRLFSVKEMACRRPSALQFLLGMGFAFVLGPMLIVVGLTLMFNMHF